MTLDVPPCALLFGPNGSSPSIRPMVSLLEAHVQAFRRAHVDDIAIVRPARDAEPSSKLGRVQLVLHSSAWKDAFDEIVLGLFALGRGPVLVLPFAHSPVSEETLEVIFRTAAKGSATHAIVP